MAREHYLEAVLTLSPLNKTAAVVVSQNGCSDDSSLSRQEIIEIKDRLERKSRLLKRVLSITNKAQHVNLVYKFNKGYFVRRFKQNPRAVVEYIHVGREIQRMYVELRQHKVEHKAAKKAARLARTVERTHK